MRKRIRFDIVFKEGHAIPSDKLLVQLMELANVNSTHIESIQIMRVDTLCIPESGIPIDPQLNIEKVHNPDEGRGKPQG